MQLIKGRNEMVPFTRRYPELKPKQALRDAKIAKRLITAWDVNQSETEVLSIFSKEHDQLSHPRYWELLKSVWIICGSVEHKDVFRKWMQSQRAFRAYFMSPEEKQAFALLPQDIVCYRACNGSDGGLSYTLDYEYAKHYRDLFGKELIEQRTVDKGQVFAFINRNAEDELIIY